MRTAKDYIRKYVYDFVKANFETLKNKEFIEGTKAQLLKDIKTKDVDGLDWVLGEILDGYEFKESGIVIFSDWLEGSNRHETVYKIGRKFVKRSFLNGEYCSKPMTYEFVKPIKKKVYVLTYEPIIHKPKSKVK